MTHDQATRQLAEFTSGLNWGAIPETIQTRVIDVVIDAIASALLGQSVGEIPRLATLVTELGSTGATTILGGSSTSEATACLVNGYLITAATICDAHLPTQAHVTPEVLPPALAVAEAKGASGAALLAGVAAGLETTTRVGLALKPPVMQKLCWHAPGITGPFGGAAAAGNLLGLSVLDQQYAFGLAGSSAAGTMAQWGTIAVKFHQGHGAMAGLLAGRLAAHGFTTCEDIFTRPDGGLLVNYSDGGDPAQLVDGLGEQWRLMDISLRSWPVGALVQSVVAAALDIRNQVSSADNVEKLVVRLPEKAYRMHADMGWHDGFSSRLSTRYIAAVVLLDGECGLDQSSDTRLTAEEVNSFARGRVSVEMDPQAADGSAAMVATLRSGDVVRAATNSPPGHPASPLTRDQVMQKLSVATAGRPLRLGPGEIAKRLEALPDEADVSSLLAGLRSAESTT
jgi:2-methylcitrate dehydratase PrpD